MYRDSIWPWFRPERILFEDESLIAIDKPVGMPSQAARPDRPDDVVTRLKKFLEARGDDSYLGTHQRLDRDTSGVLVMTRKRDANAAMAAQFEGRNVEKHYLAAVTGWPKGRERVTLRDLLESGDDGMMRVARKKNPRAQLAVTQVTVRERKGERALLELMLETGRTHQARIQLAHAGAAIAGDPIYGGALAPRLMLHAEKLKLAHPATNKPISFVAPVPFEFKSWLEKGDLGEAIYDDARAFQSALGQSVERRFALGHSENHESPTNAFRLVNEDGDHLPQLAVDVYGDHLVAQLYGDDGVWADRARRDRVLDALWKLGFVGVYLKIRPQQANTLVDTRRDELAPKLPVRGEPAPDTFTIVEEGISYGVSLGDGLSTGLFLDQRENRVRVREMSRGLRVANLFSYTCGFSLAAAVGGAIQTVSVDASLAALERGRKNLEAAGLLSDPEKKSAHKFVGEDAFSWLARASKKPERFDLIILDPPSYSSTKSRRFVASKDYPALVQAAAAIVAPGGKILACTNHRGIGKSKFRRAVGDGAKSAGRTIKQLKDLPDPLDFPPPVDRECHLKSVLLTFDD